MLMDAVTDLIGSFAGALGAHFNNYIKPFFPHLLAFLKPTNCIRSLNGGGVLCEIANGAAGCSRSIHSRLTPNCQYSSARPGVKGQRNACYLIGVLVSNARDDSIVFQKLDDILMLLNPFFNNSGSTAGNLNRRSCTPR